MSVPASDRDLRAIRSFVIRGGRLSPAQQRALEQLWAHYGIDWQPDQPLDWTTCFGRTAPVVLEIGFGMGESLVTMAQNAPECDFVGVEVHPPGIGNLLQRIEQERLGNLRLLRGDVMAMLHAGVMPEGSLTRVQIYFPDPWPKQRHHKRRLVQAALLDLLHRVVRPQGQLHIATDWQPYAEAMLLSLEQASGWRNLAADGGFVPRPPWRPVTKFERRGERLGHGVWDLLFERSDRDG